MIFIAPNPGIIQTINSTWNRHVHAWLWAGGLILVLLTAVLLLLAQQFSADRELIDKPVIILVGIMMLAGFVYAFIALKADHLKADKKHWIWVLGIGLAMRLIMMLSTPMLEDDYYRYLWDGAVTAHGFNPFAYRPSVVMDESLARKNHYPDQLIGLGQQGRSTLARINHKGIRTIYPSTAQAFFALAYLIKPWSLTAWRFIILLSDLLVLALLFWLCRTLKKPLMRVLIYWWNPLIVKEFYNSAHMDLLVVLFILGALLAVIHHRPILTGLLLALGVGTKVWPVLLAPVYFKPLLRKSRKPAALGIGVFGLVSLLLFWPVIQSTLDSSSGFTAYAGRWEMNDALFMMIAWCFKQLAFLAGGSHQAGLLWTRWFMILVLAGLVWWRLKQKNDSPDAVAQSSLLIIAALFLISPAQFPWYYAWVIPLLVVHSSPGLILMSVMLVLYYLRFYFKARNQEDIFHLGIVWLEYAPVWLILFGEALKRRRI